MEWQFVDDNTPSGEMVLGYADGMIRLVMLERGEWLTVGAEIERNWFKPTYWKPVDPPLWHDEPWGVL
jgi:hypothetical protein